MDNKQSIFENISKQLKTLDFKPVNDFKTGSDYLRTIPMVKNPLIESSDRTADALEKMLADREQDREEQNKINEINKKFNIAIVMLTSIGIVIAVIGVIVAIIGLLAK